MLLRRLAGLLLTLSVLGAAAPVAAVACGDPAAVPDVSFWPRRDNAAIPPGAVSTLADGSLIVSDFDHPQVRRLGLDGTLTRVAGTGADGRPYGENGNGGPATSAVLTPITAVAGLPDGGFALADLNGIRRVLPNGTIVQLVDAQQGSGDFNDVKYLAASSSGDLVARTGYDAIQLIRLDGTWRTVLHDPHSETVVFEDAQTILYTNYATGTIHRLSLNGGADEVIAGNGTAGPDGDGGPARQISMQPDDLAPVPGGLVFLQRDGNGVFRLQRLGSDGIVRTVVGRQVAGSSPATGPGTSVPLPDQVVLTAMRDGRVAFGTAAASDDTTPVRIADTRGAAPCTRSVGASTPPGTAQGGSTPAPPGPAAGAPKVSSVPRRATAVVSRRRRRLLLDRLVIRGPAHTTVRVSCRGTGCPHRRIALHARGRERTWAVRAWRHAALRPGAVIVVTWRTAGGRPHTLRLALRAEGRTTATA